MPNILFTLKIPWDPGRLAANRVRGQHWGELRRDEEEARFITQAWWNQADRPTVGPPPVPVRFNYVIYRARRLDDDGAIRGMKNVRDMLAKLIGLPDDSPRWVETGRVAQVIKPEYRKNEWTEILVEAREG